jgi:hypothetical protein
MSRSTSRRLVLAFFVVGTALASACTRTDATGPSEQPQASFSETQGADN